MSSDRYLEYDRCKQMSLQEAFRIFKYNVILNSRKRVRDIKAKEAKRQVETELKLNDFKMLQKKLHSMNHHHYHGRLRQSSSSSSSNYDMERRKKYEYFTIVPPASKSRNMTHKEIKDQTKKNYQKLPEVQQKKLREKLEENKIKNRIKSNLYKKVIHLSFIFRFILIFFIQINNFPFLRPFNRECFQMDQILI